MGKHRRFIAGLILILAGGLAVAGDCSSLDSLEWILGDWETSGEKVIKESWKRVSPDTFEGTGEGETLRLLQMAGEVFYIARPLQNRYPVPFRLTACDDGQAVFENPGHDFPRRIEYRLEADGTLTVLVSDGTDKGFRLSFGKSPDPS